MATAVAGKRAPAHYGNLQHTALSAFWFGSNFLWIPLTTVLIQAQVDEVVPKGSQNTAIGVALGIRGLLAMTVPLVIGADAALTLIPTVWDVRSEGLVRIDRQPHRPVADAVGVFLRPVHEGDFEWVVFTRVRVS